MLTKYNSSASTRNRCVFLLNSILVSITGFIREQGTAWYRDLQLLLQVQGLSLKYTPASRPYLFTGKLPPLLYHNHTTVISHTVPGPGVSLEVEKRSSDA